nr:unnamed protein product [Spirometra erinaceieuropaei]
MSETPKHTNASIIPTTSGANTVDATSTTVSTSSNEDSLRTCLNSRGASTSRIGLVNYLRIHCTGLTNQGQHRIATLVSTATARIVTASEDLAACARMQIFGELQPLLNARIKWLTPSPEKPKRSQAACVARVDRPSCLFQPLLPPPVSVGRPARTGINIGENQRRTRCR